MENQHRQDRANPPARGYEREINAIEIGHEVMSIAGGFTSGGTKSGIKQYLNSVKAIPPTRYPHTKDDIRFTDENAEGLLCPHDDLMVI